MKKKLKQLLSLIQTNKKIFIGMITILLVLVIVLVNLFNKGTFAISTTTTYYGGDKVLGNGVKNIFLTYFSSNSKNRDCTLTYPKSYGESEFNYLINYNGEKGHEFMDTFLFLPYVNFEICEFDRNNQGNITDTWWVDYIYYQNLNLNELNKAAKGAKKEVNVILTLINPFYDNGNNGLDSYKYCDNGENNYCKNPDSTKTINEIIKSMVDKQLYYWNYNKNNGNFSNLNLIGFYWFNESVQSDYAATSIKIFTDVVRKSGYKSVWIPYIHNGILGSGWGHPYQDSYVNGYEYGFDYVSLQSGHYFRFSDDDKKYWDAIMEKRGYPAGVSRLEFAKNEGFRLNMGIEFEADDNITKKVQYDLLYEFMEYGSKIASWNQAYNVYYFPLLGQYPVSAHPIKKQIYDDVYKYSQGKEVTKNIEYENANKCKINFNSNIDGAVGGTNSLTCEYNNSCNLTRDIFSKTGYTFNSWNTKSDGTGASYDGVNNTNSEYICFYSYVENNSKKLDLYAQWTPNSYTIKYDRNGADGTEEMSDTLCTYDSNCTLNENLFTKAGYTFNSWNTKSDGTGTSYNNVAQVRNLSSVNGASVVLYAIYDINEYLEFDESLDIDEDNTIINNIKVGTNINSVIGKINTSGNVSVLDKNDNVIEDSTSNLGTGYKFKIELYSQTLYYTISVRGDINGDRQVNINDVIGVSKHVIKGNVISGIEYVNASDVNDNGNIDINDVIKLAKHIIKDTEL